jgi:anthranilate phosphoribosyltransferase
MLDAPHAVSCARVLRALDVPPSASLAQADEDLAGRGIAFVPVQLLCPALARVLALRSRLGVQSLAHRAAQLIDPTHGAAMRIVLDAEEATPPMAPLLASLEGTSLVLTWSGGGPPAGLGIRPRIERFHAGAREVLFEADTHEMAPQLPRLDDAGALASIVRAISTGRVTVPVPALNLVAACLYASGRAPDLPRAKAAAAVAGGRLAA